MSDENNSQQASTADAAVIQSAEAAVMQAKAAVDMTNREREAAAQREAALIAKVASLEASTPDAAKMEQIDRFILRERNEARLSTLKRMGFDAPLGDAQILALAPDVDPREPEGMAKLEEWRQQNQRMFRAAGPSQESIAEAVRLGVGALQKKSGLVSTDKLVASLLGGKGRNR